MSKENEKEPTIIVITIDRDNDLGRKAKVQGPVIGEQKNIEAATKLSIADPEESDANTMFAAIKKYKEAKKEFAKVEVVTVTGYDKSNLKSDKEVNRQLDAIQKKYDVKGWILLTDGKEDDQTIPILSSRARIISKESVIIKQAQAVESTYYTIKEALKDPSISRTLFGIPGIIIILFIALGSISIQIFAFLFGSYLVLKGFGIEDRIIKFSNNITSSVSSQRISFPFYIGSVFIAIFGLITAYNKITIIGENIIMEAITATQATYPFFALAAISIVLGRATDIIHMKKAFLLRKYTLSIVSILLLWYILDSGTLVFVAEADLSLFLTSILTSFIILLITIKVTTPLDIRDRITKILIGLPVYKTDGMLIGKVIGINRKKQTIKIEPITEEQKIEYKQNQFTLRNGRILLNE